MQAAWVPVSHTTYHGHAATLLERENEFRLTFGSQSFALESGEYHSAGDSRVRVARLGSNGEKLIAVILAIHYHSGGVASVAKVYRLVGNKLKQVMTLQSNQNIGLVKLGQSRDAIVRSYEIGGYVGHYKMPRWPELFRVSGDRAVQIRYSPAIYSPFVDEIWSVLKETPQDESLWGYFGLAVRFSGRHISAKSAFRRMKHFIAHATPADRIYGPDMSYVRQDFRKTAAKGKYPTPQYHPLFWFGLDPKGTGLYLFDDP